VKDGRAEKGKKMNANYKSNIIANWLWQGFSAVFVLAFVTSVVAQTPTFRANGKIAFTSDRDGNREIYVMDADGTNQVRLTNNSVVDDHPTWSPDGMKIAFVSERIAGGFAIFVMNADGTNKVEVTSLIFNATAYPIWDIWGMSWSPDGNRIVFQEKVEPSTAPAYPNDIFLVDIDGRNRQLLLRDPADDRQPSWSPDGSKILFSRGVSTFYHNLFTIRPDGTDLQPLANFPGDTDLSATWSPTGSMIAFMTFDYANFENIQIANADGTNRQTAAASGRIGAVAINRIGLRMAIRSFFMSHSARAARSTPKSL